jgi:hypothetical protein
MAAEAGHFPSRIYIDLNGDEHLNGANLFDINEKAVAQKITFSPATGSSNVCLVTVQVQDGRGANIASNFELLVYLSDDPGGNGLTATSASGAVGAGTAGTDLSAKVAKKATDVLTDNTGKYILSITDSAKTGFYIAAIVPGTGNVQVSSQLVSANYG